MALDSTLYVDDACWILVKQAYPRFHLMICRLLLCDPGLWKRKVNDNCPVSVHIRMLNWETPLTALPLLCCRRWTAVDNHVVHITPHSYGGYWIGHIVATHELTY